MDLSARFRNIILINHHIIYFTFDSLYTLYVTRGGLRTTRDTECQPSERFTLSARFEYEDDDNDTNDCDDCNDNNDCEGVNEHDNDNNNCNGDDGDDDENDENRVPAIRDVYLHPLSGLCNTLVAVIMMQLIMTLCMIFFYIFHAYLWWQLVHMKRI